MLRNLPPRSLASLFFFFFALGFIPRLTADTALNIPGYRLQWYDEFEASAIDITKWDVAEGINAGYGLPNGDYVEPQWFNEDISNWTFVNPINSEEQYYSPDNVSVNDGVLEIEARLETVTNPYGAYDPNYHRYTSGKLNTADEFQFTFGIVKWRAQLPAGDGMWPALWMLNDPQPDWYWDDEIDVMEARGSLPFVTTSAHHYKIDVGGGALINNYRSGELSSSRNLQTSFNEYGLEWKADKIRTTLNGTQVLMDEDDIPQGPMFLIMNAAVGGFFDPAPVDDAVLAAGTKMRIDWVRVWQPSAKPSDLSNGGFEDFQGPQWADWNTTDDGNLSTAATALHGSSSVRIAQLNNPAPVSQTGPNLLDAAGGWAGWLNETTGSNTTGQSISPSSIPATTSGHTATISVHASSSATLANSVIYRQLPGSALLGLDLTYAGTVVIDEAFAPGATAIAFIRVFAPGFGSFVDHQATITSSGDFSIPASIPSSNVGAVQFGIETTGVPGSNGILTATNLSLVDDAATAPLSENLTGFEQTVVVAPGQGLRYGVLTLNDPGDPLSSGAEGRLRLEFLTGAEGLLGTVTRKIVDSSSSTREPTPYTAQATAPVGTAFARLTIERITSDELTDTGGAFLADAAFLQVTSDSHLPVFTALPPSTLTVVAGDPVTLPVTVASPTALSYQWYHAGFPVDTAEDASFAATPASGGRYFVIASNAAGPVIGGWTDLTVTTVDSDNDLVIDYDEIFVYGTNPNKADTDGDGDDDYKEIFVTRTDPNNPASRFLLTDVTLGSGTVELTFPTSINVTYTFEASANLVDWQLIGGSHPGDGTSNTVSMALPVTNPPLRYFRTKAAALLQD